MLDFLAGAVTVLLVAPLLAVPAAGLLFLVAGLAGDPTHRVRARFACPWVRRLVTADFVVSPGAAHTCDVVSCTAFRDPARVECAKACRRLTDVRWSVSRGLFPRWALTAGDAIGWDGTTVGGHWP